LVMVASPSLILTLATALQMRAMANRPVPVPLLAVIG